MHPPNRRELLSGGAALIGAASLAACTPPEPDPLPEAMARGARWLWGQQDERGAFASKTFGFLALGQSLTPLALLALADVPPEILPTPKSAADAIAAMLSMVDEDGALGFAGPAPDYPVYATAMALSALARLSPSTLERWGPRLSGWLLKQQLRAGWEGHPGQGGFPMGSRAPLIPPEAGHVDLSMTRRAAEALRAVGVDPGPLGDFVLRCSAPDGGFIYSPVDLALNKGGCEGRVCAGYGSATCDGLLALLAVGVSTEAPRVQQALSALQAAHRVDRNPGVAENMGDFTIAMRFYYRAASAQVFHRLGGPEGWRAQLTQALLAEQQPDGRWQNESPLQKESDPIVATSFALMALACCLGG
ncbi:MAG: terpene cyclase/mutase family protein [Alphaproteobacteria bacterium]|nr:terpene cyclase/mutase family protein [Alphaproteobacteria bacterium]